MLYFLEGTADAAQQGGFAGTGMTYDSEKFTLVNVQTNILKRMTFCWRTFLIRIVYMIHL